MKPAKLLFLTLLIATIAPSLGGCGMLIAEIDADAAIARVNKLNVANWKTAAIDKDNSHRLAAAKLETALEDRLRASSGGEKAVAILEGYRKERAIKQAARAADREIYGRALDNAILGDELMDRKLALRARWTGIAERSTAVSHLRAIAEMEARRYVDTIGKTAKETRSAP